MARSKKKTLPAAPRTIAIYTHADALQRKADKTRAKLERTSRPKKARKRQEKLAALETQTQAMLEELAAHPRWRKALTRYVVTVHDVDIYMKVSQRRDRLRPLLQGFGMEAVTAHIHGDRDRAVVRISGICNGLRLASVERELHRVFSDELRDGSMRLAVRALHGYRLEPTTRLKKMLPTRPIDRFVRACNGCGKEAACQRIDYSGGYSSYGVVDGLLLRFYLCQSCINKEVETFRGLGPAPAFVPDGAWCRRCCRWLRIYIDKGYVLRLPVDTSSGVRRLNVCEFCVVDMADKLVVAPVAKDYIHGDIDDWIGAKDVIARARLYGERQAAEAYAWMQKGLCTTQRDWDDRRLMWSRCQKLAEWEYVTTYGSRGGFHKHSCCATHRASMEANGFAAVFQPFQTPTAPWLGAQPLPPSHAVDDEPAIEEVDQPAGAADDAAEVMEDWDEPCLP